MSSKLLVPLLTVFLWSGSVWAYQSPEAFIADIDSVLTHRQIERLIPREHLSDVGRLAQEEDMELEGTYLISDDMLRLFRRESLLDSKFGQLIEDFQAEVDRLDQQKRLEATAQWRSFWLEKVFDHLRYVRSLKPVWSFALTQNMDYTNNVNLTADDPIVVNTQVTDKNDVSFGLDGLLIYKPLINHNRNKDWDYRARVGGGSQFYGSEDQLESETVNLGQTATFDNPMDKVRNLKLDYSFLRLYSDNAPTTNFSRHAFTVSASSDLTVMTDRYFSTRNQFGSLHVRLKDEHGSKDDLVTFRAIYGWRYLRGGNSTPFSSLSWNLEYQNESSDLSPKRDYDSLGLKIGYFEVLPAILDDRSVNWNSSVLLRMRDYSSPVAATVDSKDETELLLSSSLNTNWNAYFSSSLAFSYYYKDRDVLGGGSEDVSQWKVMIINQLLTL